VAANEALGHALNTRYAMLKIPRLISRICTAYPRLVAVNPADLQFVAGASIDLGNVI